MNFLGFFIKKKQLFFFLIKKPIRDNIKLILRIHKQLL